MLDGGLNTQKPRGSYANMPGRRGKFGSRPLDLDLMAQRGWDFGSNLIRLLRIGRPWSNGVCGTAALVDGDQSPRRRTGETRRSRAISILQGSKRAGLWPGTIAGACVIYLATQGQGLGRGAPCAAAAAALGWRMSPARHARTPKACYGPQQHAQRIEGWLLVLTGVQDGRGSRAEGATARTGGEGETELASGGRGRGAPGSWTPPINVGCSCGSGGSSARLRWRWSVVERRSRGGAEARRGGARRSGMEAALELIGFQGCSLRCLKGARRGLRRGAAGLGSRRPRR